jgi:hypothetical protein
MARKTQQYWFENFLQQPRPFQVVRALDRPLWLSNLALFHRLFSLSKDCGASWLLKHVSGLILRRNKDH